VTVRRTCSIRPSYGKVRCWLFGQFFHGQAERLITVADDVSAIYVGLGFQ
jgi:hypothetical protein